MQFYNVYIEHNENSKQYIIVLNEEQIDKLITSYLHGEHKIKIKGVDRLLNNPRKFIIYSITDSTLGSEQSEIEFNLTKIKYLFGGKITLQLFQKFGTNVTDNLTRGKDWGTLKMTSKPTPKVIFNSSNEGKIFISHSVKDKKVVQGFTESILQLGLGVKPDEDIFNISIEDSGIKTGDDFKRRIENELKSSKAVILIITMNYKNSEVCMNEMGASWILGIPVIPFIFEPITYNSVGFVHNTTQLLKLNSKDDLKAFVAQNKGKLFSSDYNDAKLDRHIDNFLESIGR